MLSFLIPSGICDPHDLVRPVQIWNLPPLYRIPYFWGKPLHHTTLQYFHCYTRWHFSLQRTLNRLFPLEAGRYKSSDRILPTLQGEHPACLGFMCLVHLHSTSVLKGNTFARARNVQKTRLKAIEDYCQVCHIIATWHMYTTYTQCAN